MRPYFPQALIGFLPSSPGTYPLSVWHAGPKTELNREVRGKPNGTLSMNYGYESPVVRCSIHEIPDNSHFGLEIFGEGVEIAPTWRLQISSWPNIFGWNIGKIGAS